MKNLKYIAIIAIAIFGFIVSCEDAEIPQIDVNDSTPIAGFSSGNTATPKIIFDPSQDTENIITVGVSTLSEQDRAVVITLDEDASTLDPSYYSINTLNPVIPAGEFTTDIVITTFGTPDLPSTNDVINLTLTSVEGATLGVESEGEIDISLTISCPTVDLESIPGIYNIIVDEFDTTVGDLTFEIIAGPGANQVTMVNPFDHPNPDDGGAQSYDVVIDIDTETGTARIERQAAWHCQNFGCGFGEGRIDGSGIALTCINQIQFPALRHTVDAGSFGSYVFNIEKQ